MNTIGYYEGKQIELVTIDHEVFRPEVIDGRETLVPLRML